jgi:CarD family transcriptional regulator
MQFRIGDKALYPTHGVASIEGLETKEVAGERIDFYVLKIISSGATLMVPVQSCARVGLRNLLSHDEITNVYDILKSPARRSQKAWNRRIKEFNDKLRTGSIYDVAEVTRDLLGLQIIKDLSYGEKKILEKCMALLADEIAASSGVTSLEVTSDIHLVLARA